MTRLLRARSPALIPRHSVRVDIDEDGNGTRLLWRVRIENSMMSPSARDWEDITRLGFFGLSDPAALGCEFLKAAARNGSMLLSVAGQFTIPQPEG
jgi:hypothetical protein